MSTASTLRNKNKSLERLLQENTALKDYIWELERMLEENCIAEKHQMREYLDEELHSALED